MKKSVGMLVILVMVVGMLPSTGCIGPNCGEGQSSCTVWYGKPGISIIGDSLETGTVYLHKVTYCPKTRGQIIVWQKCNGGKFIGDEKVTTTSGFVFPRLSDDSKGYYVILHVPGSGMAFSKCD